MISAVCPGVSEPSLMVGFCINNRSPKKVLTQLANW